MRKQDESQFNVSERISKLIYATGLSVSAFSQITGIPYSTLEGWINGDPNIKVDSIRRFCDAMRIEQSFFFKNKMTELDRFCAACRFWGGRMTEIERKHALSLLQISVMGGR